MTDNDGIWRINSRIHGYSSILLPTTGDFTKRLIEDYHQGILYWGVQATMCGIRERSWIPKLRSAVKSTIYNCNLCKRYHKRPLKPPATGNLPRFRSELDEPFQTTGIDFAGPLIYKDHDQEMKGYIVIFNCATTRAVHLKLSRSMLTEELKYTFKEFIARHGIPRTVISDNAKAFKAASNWLKTIVHDEDFFNFLNLHRIEWKLNMLRAPWWGGFFERLIGIMKRALTKKIGRALLRYHELEDVLLDIECFMNNRPLCYVTEEFD